MSDYHESWEALPEEVRDIHRALTSLCEEVEAIDWYHQRVALCTDPGLKAILAHNRNEEIEHACMVIEWLRRSMPAWNEHLRAFLFKDAPVTEIEDGAPAGDGAATGARDLRIGKPREGA